jgi:hypothetical protein
MKKIILLLFIFVFTINCEKDDICDPAKATTPRLVIKFFNASNINEEKTVSNLIVYYNNKPIDSITNSSSIKIPLNTATDETSLRFVLNGFNDITTDDNEDIVTFNYTRQDVYVSRACGYKTLFELAPTNPVIVAADAQNWIQNTSVIQPVIKDENETHLHIFY